MPSRDHPAAARRICLLVVTAVTLLVPGCASSGARPAPAAPALTGGLLAVEKVGGMCPSGEECRYVVTLDADGSWTTESDSGEVRHGTASAETVAQVATAVAEADREALVATPFTGECERHMDGTEVVLTLRPGQPDELELPGCTYALPRTGSLASAAQTLLETARR